MPSSTFRHLGNPQGAVPGLSFPASYRPPRTLISTISYEAIGNELSGMATTNTAASTAYGTANRAIGYPFQIGEFFLVQKVFWVNGTTATTDNADVAVYTEDGATRIVAAGSTAIATANVVQEVDVTDTLLPPGRYWCVYNQNGTTATPICIPANLAVLRPAGVAQFSGAVPLGSTFTPAAMASNLIPVFGIANRTQVA